MRTTLILALLISLVLVSSNQASVRPDAGQSMRAAEQLSLEALHLMERGIPLEDRWRQVYAIATVFSRRTDEVRAWHLARLCYLKTLGTTFTPFDLAEIALAETGGHRLEAVATSPRGARGVWQLMPRRAAIHGYSPEDLLDDAKCADAAVRELKCKLWMAGGDLVLAKRLYCGAGPEAREYSRRLKRYGRELRAGMQTLTPRQALTGIDQFPS